MIVPFIYDLYESEKIAPKSLSIFYKFVNFCTENNFPIIAQEKFFKNPSYYKKKNHWALSNDGQYTHEYKIPSQSNLDSLSKYIISNEIDKRIIAEFNNEVDAVYSLMNKKNTILSRYIEKYIKEIEKTGHIEAFIVWLWNPSLESVAKKYHIPIIQMENSPIRIPAYRERMGYFKFGNKYDNKSIKQQFNLYKKNMPKFDRKELLALFLAKDKIDNLKKYDNISEYEIGYALGLENDLFEKSYSKATRQEVMEKLNNTYDSNNVVLRWHPADLNKASYNYNFKEDKSASSESFLFKCERIICNISNIAYDANLYNKIVINLSDAVPTAFGSVDSNFDKEERMSLEQLNFLTFYCYTPYELMFDSNYIRWRLTKPNVNTIYSYNLHYFLKKYHIEDVFRKKKQDRLKYILEKTRKLSSKEIFDYCSEENIMKKSPIINFIPTNKLKRKVVNKIKFSNKFNEKMLGIMRKYKYGKNDILPILYCGDKIAINIECEVEEQKLKEFLDKVLFPFDLYYNFKTTKIKNMYINNIFNKSIFTDIKLLKDYKYIINVNSEENIGVFKYGLIESCLSLLMKKETSFINIGKTNYNLENVAPWNKKDFISNEIDIENLFYNKTIEISKINIFDTSIIQNCLINKSYKENEDIYFFLKSIFLNSDSPLKVINDFNKERIIKKNKFQSYTISYNDLKNEIDDVDTVTFDVFDTLITRRILTPDDLFLIMDKKINDKLEKSFIEIRKEAEIEANKKLNKDIDLTDIYNEMKVINNFTSEQIESYKAMELNLEKEYLIPRKDMVKLYNELVNEGKNIDIISDMYICKKNLIEILNNCGINDYRNIYLSCDINKRKDNGSMWDYYFENNKETTLHIGDNYISDYVEVLKRGRKAIKILSGSDWYRDTFIFKNYDVLNSESLGKLYNEIIFNSPFFNKKEFENNLEQYGKYYLAPIFKVFLDWYTKVNISNNILFVSREGYYLQKIYKEYCKIFNVSEINNKYFLTSRRAVSFAACKTTDDLLEIMNMEFHGTISEFFNKRYGYTLKEENKEQINLPTDKEKVEILVKDNSKKLLKYAEIERNEYLKYIDKNFEVLIEDKPCIIDLGYSGTTQYYLSRLLDKKIDGYYFALSNNPKPKKLDCFIKGCFNENNDDIDDTNLFYTRALVLESFLSAPTGQLIKFMNGKPIYNDGKFNEKKIKYLDKIYTGIIDGLNLLKQENLDFNIESMNEHYKFICNYLTGIDGELEKVFYLDDDFCTNGSKQNKMI